MYCRCGKELSEVLPWDNVSHLYRAENIANALNVATNVCGNDATNADVDATLFLCAFAHEGERDYKVPYNLLGRGESRSILYVRREIKHGRKWGINSSFPSGVSI